MNKGYYGISFPFRLGVRGGVVMSGTSALDFQHIDESIKQILNTKVGERVMEYNFGSNVSTALFEPDDLSIQTLIKYEVLKALQTFEPRITVTDKDISINSDNDHNIIYVNVNYVVKDFANESHTTNVKLGGEKNV